MPSFLHKAVPTFPLHVCCGPVLALPRRMTTANLTRWVLFLFLSSACFSSVPVLVVHGGKWGTVRYEIN